MQIDIDDLPSHIKSSSGISKINLDDGLFSDDSPVIPFEKLKFLKKVHNTYLNLSVGNRFLKIDATKKIEDIVKICYNDIIS